MRFVNNPGGQEVKVILPNVELTLK